MRHGGGVPPGPVEFISPRRTLAVSITGEECSLNCAHCGGHYLKGMIPLGQALDQRSAGIRSYLISGGCNREGKIPFRSRWVELKALSRRGALNIHCGLVDKGEAMAIGQIARVVSFDFAVDGEVIDSIYGLSASPGDYIQSYRYLRRYSKVVPHICIGILGGRIGWEYSALHLLKQEGAESISFIVFRPTPGTALADCTPPRLEEVAGVLAEARALFPRIPLCLGCLRPGGRYRDHLDRLALEIGINKIVQPAAAVRRVAVKRKQEVIYREECCAF